MPIDPDRLDGRPAETLALRPRPPEPCPHPLRDQAPFKFGDRRDDREHRLAEGGASVDLLAQAHELDAEVTEEFEGLDEVAHRAAEAVEGGDDHNVDPPGLHLPEQAIQGGPLLLGPGDALVDEFDRLPPRGR